MSKIVLEVNDLTVAYREKTVLWDVDFHAYAQSLTAIIGPNGAGKSTLIKSILAITKPLAGRVLVYDKPYNAKTGLVAYIPQRSSVDWDFPTNVLDVVLMGLYGKVGFFKRLKKRHYDKAYECLEKVGMQDFSKRQIGELSGGQQQRVFIARAFVQEPSIYLMDEPFAGVDINTEYKIVEILKQLKNEGKTVICVHHNLETLKEYFDYACLLNVRMVASGKVEDVLNQGNLKQVYGGMEKFLSK